ncbi:MAG TPA: hypothetical protein VF677_01780 [Flavobacterium sp.]|jgi:hypothetical protein
MKTNIFILAFFSLLQVSCISAQNITTVNARNSDISDNLDLRAIASIFGDAANLEDFERRLNNPNLQISNLDLNNDGRVDYLRVVESVESRTHVIVIQAVLGADVFQDVATVEVERNNNGQVQVQVVGDVYMYGQNYIYEPVYVTRPVIYTTFWVNSYRPYYSPWRWNYYPTYYQAWNPYPVYTYRRNINQTININHNYNYVNVRRSQRAAAIYDSRRSNGYERLNPGRSFIQRNNVSNRYELDRTRTTALNGRRTGNDMQNSYSTRNENGTRLGSYTGRNANSTRVTTQNENAGSRRNSYQRSGSPTRITNSNAGNSANTYRRAESGTRATTRSENTTGNERSTYQTSESPRASTRRNESSMQNNPARMTTPSTRVVNPENVRSASEQRNTGAIERSESRNTFSPTRVQSAPQPEYSRTSNDSRRSSGRENSGSTRSNYRN